jgi:ABC-type phosphate/phosphonate transport system permease subunit
LKLKVCTRKRPVTRIKTQNEPITRTGALKNSRISELLSAFVAMVVLLVFLSTLTWWLMPVALWGVIIGWIIALPLGLLLLVFLGPKRPPP